MNAGKLTPTAVALAIVVLSGAAVLYATHVPAVVPASAPAGLFSAARAMQHVSELARPNVPVAAVRNDFARAYVIRELRFIGLEPEIQSTTGVGTRYAVAGPVQNIAVRLPGRRPGGPAVLLMAHYDAVPASHGASDDGSGTATLLETLRALRSSAKLEHDVIALFTDQEEPGLLGAAAFVREHPWSRDVAVVLNFEARGTHGPSLMFETGPGNLEVVRVLRHVRDVHATSLSTAVYRQLPNDTDLSELALLGEPAMNFAYIGGVERYHTAEDDAMHIDPQSLQHHGNQALALARLFGNGPLPLPRTSDAVFFNVPLLGLVLYPESWAAIFAALAVLLAVFVVLRARRPSGHVTRGTIVGVVATVAAALLATLCAILVARALQSLHGSSPTGGRPEWSGVYATAIAALCVAIAGGVHAIARRFADYAAFQAGVLLFWALLAALVTVVLPGGSFLFTWPAIVMALAVLAGARWERWRLVPMWIATAIAIFVVVPIVYVMACTALGVGATGAAILGVFTALLTLLLTPHLEAIARSQARVPRVPVYTAAASVGLFAIGAFTVRTTAAHPGAAGLIYAVDVDSNTAWLTGYAVGGSSHAALQQVLRAANEGMSARQIRRPPDWLVGMIGSRTRIIEVPVIPVAPPTITILADSSTGSERRVTLRFRPGVSQLAVVLTADAGLVQRAAVNGKPVATDRYRQRSGAWRLEYTSPTDSGFTVTLGLPANAHGTLALRGIVQGLQPLPDVRLPRRPEHILPIQNGDMSWIFRRFPL